MEIVPRVAAGDGVRAGYFVDGSGAVHALSRLVYCLFCADNLWAGPDSEFQLDGLLRCGGQVLRNAVCSDEHRWSLRFIGEFVVIPDSDPVGR